MPHPLAGRHLLTDTGDPIHDALDRAHSLSAADDPRAALVVTLDHHAIIRESLTMALQHLYDARQRARRDGDIIASLRAELRAARKTDA